jgi:3-oxoacyl-(acyl-carrier-protein) synthase
MDKGARSIAGDTLVVTGLGHVVSAPCDPTPYLKVRKNRKFMGVQDDLAVVAAGLALKQAGLASELGERVGLYLAVGYIPFEQSDIDQLLENSIDDGRLSMQRLSTTGYSQLNPLLTFRCLSNMPAFHISMNFDIQGPYFVTYPGPGQFYVALDQACAALRSHMIDIAIICGVAHQQNFLVEHHFRRIEPAADRLLDAGGCLVSELAEHATQRGARVRAVLRQYDIHYRAHNPFQESLKPREIGADPAMGPASLPVALSVGCEPMLRHEISGRDGINASSIWELVQ